MIEIARTPGDRGSNISSNFVPSSWAFVLALILLVLAARLAYLVWLCPYELVGDEAYYWVQSQHLDWSYREKGPLLPWTIALSCHLFGNVEWAARLPVALGSALAAWGVGKLSFSHTHGDKQSALLAVVIFLLVPAFQANAQILTQDGLLIGLLVALTAVGLRLVRRWEGGQDTWAEWLGLWALFGVGILLKQSALLFGVSFVPFVIARFHRLRWRPTFFAQQIAGVLLMLVVASPVLLWEFHHGWPMLEHTLGHLGLGADHASKPGDGNRLEWLGDTIGGILGAGGPGFILLSLWASWEAIRTRDREPDRWPDRLWLLCAAWPSILFFILLSFVKVVVPSWPLPCLVPLVVLVAEFASCKWASLRWPIGLTGVSRTEVASHPRQGDGFSRLWWILVAYGMVAAGLIMFPTVLSHLPIIGSRLDRSVLSRIQGSRAEAEAIDAIAMSIPTPDGKRPIVVTNHYMRASLYSFYMPHKELTVTTSGGYVGSRPSNFDTWDDTRLSNPAFHGRSLLLDGGAAEAWRQRLQFDSIRRVDFDRNVLLATNFGGRTDFAGQATEEIP